MPRADRSSLVRYALPFAVAIVGVGIGYVLSLSLSGYFVYLGISVVVATIAILGLGVVTGSAGMISLCQLTFAAVGAWVVSGLNVINAPGGFIVWLILGGAAAGAVGVIIGLPALRLRGVNLAVVTLGFAAAADVTLVQIQFPGAAAGDSVLRPDAFSTDPQFFFFSVLVLAVCALVLYFVQNGRWGAGWKAVAFSERGTASVGASVSVSKLTAFAVSATLGGISGGLIAGQVGLAFASSFEPIQSLALYVLSIMTGAHLIDMAILGGILWIAVPEILKRLGIDQDWGFVIFGALGVQALASGSTL
ncbi:branched-chain amino acid ABC transporter permease, partial [Humibacter sp.]|uniref:branched-chain amino acid ABC transporter permease n=1 Tax=Humibacter sp. TaxID=1940291 RepID=UPI003F7D09C8